MIFPDGRSADRPAVRRAHDRLARFLLRSPWPSLVVLILLLLFLFRQLLLLVFFLVFLATLVSHACSFSTIMTWRSGITARGCDLRRPLHPEAPARVPERSSAENTPENTQEIAGSQRAACVDEASIMDSVRDP
jgi:hypothetical protein